MLGIQILDRRILRLLSPPFMCACGVVWRRVGLPNYRSRAPNGQSLESICKRMRNVNKPRMACSEGELKMFEDVRPDLRSGICLVGESLIKVFKTSRKPIFKVTMPANKAQWTIRRKPAIANASKPSLNAILLVCEQESATVKGLEELDEKQFQLSIAGQRTSNHIIKERERKSSFAFIVHHQLWPNGREREQRQC